MFSGLARINTAAMRSFSHSLTFGIELAVFTNILQFAYTKTAKSRKGLYFCRKWSPFFILVLATCLSMADLVRHLVNDSWSTVCKEIEKGQVIKIDDKQLGSEYNKYCYSQSVASEYTDTGALSVYGWVLTIFCTWSGFVLLFVGIFWLINFPEKLRQQWRRARGGSRAVVVASGPSAEHAPASRGAQPLIGAA